MKAWTSRLILMKYVMRIKRLHTLRFEVISKSEEVIGSVPAAHKKNFVFQVISKSEEVIGSVPAAHIDRLPLPQKLKIDFAVGCKSFVKLKNGAKPYYHLISSIIFRSFLKVKEGCYETGRIPTKNSQSGQDC